MEKTRLEQIQSAVETGYTKLTESLIREALSAGEDPRRIMEGAIIPAMRTIGQRYQDNEDELMQILVTARCMQKGMDLLQPHLRGEREIVGKVLLGTVEGDLHDMGKNLVCVMLKSAGFEVVDLGVDVSAQQFIRAARSMPDTDIICLSCLLSTCMKSMRNTVQAIKRDKDLNHLFVMVGGSPITEIFARSIGADAYTENAVQAAQVAAEHCRGKGK